MSDQPRTPPGTSAGPAAEQNMDEILASIRRTLSDDAGQAAPKPADKDVLILEPSMLVPVAAPAAPTAEPAAVPEIPAPPPTAQLVAPAAAAAAASAVGELVRTLAVERSTPVVRGGPTIEDLVREEIRPLLKAWLDTHLPQMVERAVQAEIERVIARSSA